MKIGKLVQSYIKEICLYCETNPDELSKLMELEYSKKVFNINYFFFVEVKKIDTIYPDDKVTKKYKHERYWKDHYFVGEKEVRVTSQWVEGESRKLFEQYLKEKKIPQKENTRPNPETNIASSRAPSKQRTNSRYKGNAIGNAQNLVVRNILSNLGYESFNQDDWNATKAFFSRCCAYCGLKAKLEIDHAIPINKQSLGEHRLGNLVPACKSCNSKKHKQNFTDFLDDEERIKKIKEYMDCKNYVPLADNEQVKMILDMAYNEISQVSERYIKILNELFPK